MEREIPFKWGIVRKDLQNKFRNFLCSKIRNFKLIGFE